MTSIDYFKQRLKLIERSIVHATNYADNKAIKKLIEKRKHYENAVIALEALQCKTDEFNELFYRFAICLGIMRNNPSSDFFKTEKINYNPVPTGACKTFNHVPTGACKIFNEIPRGFSGDIPKFGSGWKYDDD